MRMHHAMVTGTNIASLHKIQTTFELLNKTQNIPTSHLTLYFVELNMVAVFRTKYFVARHWI
jgi:hypothetical protein